MINYFAIISLEFSLSFVRSFCNLLHAFSSTIVTLNVSLIMLQHKSNERHQAGDGRRGKQAECLRSEKFLKLICSTDFLLTKSIKTERMERKWNRYWSDFYSHHMCVSNENKTHNLASLTIDDWQQWVFLLQFCFWKKNIFFMMICSSEHWIIPEPMNLTVDVTGF